MSDTGMLVVKSYGSETSTRNISGQSRWLKYVKSPLWIILLIAVLVRVWLIVHTHGTLDGDEATAGIQAENILRGAHPIYYYGQAYMGSLEAYFVAFIFLFTGPSIWALRVEPLLLCLAIVYLTWRFAAALADAAHLSPRLKTVFMVIAALIAAFPPLYDVVEELRVKGGYTEAFLIMLWLLFCTFRLTQRWSQTISRRELVLRWLGIGFLIGLGFWVDPLITYAVAAISLWLSGYFLWRLIHSHRELQKRLLVEALLCLSTIPAAIVGFTPGLIWGARHGWANIHYIFQSGGEGFSSKRLDTILHVQRAYVSCLAPRALGGALATQPDVTVANPHILTLGLVVVGISALLSIACVIFSLFAKHSHYACMRKLVLLPLLFWLLTSLIFCVASISVGATYAPCGPVDLVGRYTVALVVTLPFVVASAVVFPLFMLQEKRQNSTVETDIVSKPRNDFSWQMSSIQLGLLVILVAYFVAQGVAYIKANPRTTFHPTACAAESPTDLSPLISYMEREHIQYAWATFWTGSPIIFETNGAIIVTEDPGRIPAYSNEVLHAKHPSFLVLAWHNGPLPPLVQAMNAQHVIYHIARFYSEPGIDMLVVTPLNKTVSPLDPTYTSLIQRTFIGCVEEE